MINIDFNKIVLERIPQPKRTPIRFAWLKALIVGLRTLYVDWLNFYANAQIRAYESSQTLILEKILNDDYDADLRRIKIQNRSGGSYHHYIYTRGENPQNKTYVRLRSESVTYDKKVFIRFGSEFIAQTGTFAVYLPPDLFADSALNTLIRNRVNSLKMATVSFEILKYTP